MTESNQLTDLTDIPDNSFEAYEAMSDAVDTGEFLIIDVTYAIGILLAGIIKETDQTKDEVFALLYKVVDIELRSELNS